MSSREFFGYYPSLIDSENESLSVGDGASDDVLDTVTANLPSVPG